MNKILLMQSILLLTGAIVCNAQTKLSLPRLQETTKKSALDQKKIDKLADSMICEFFGTKSLRLDDVPKEMQSELLFKRTLIIQELEKLSEQNMDAKTKNLKIQNFMTKFFEEFIARVKYVQLSELNSLFLAAIKEKKAMNKNATNSSYPDVVDTKKHLFNKMQ